MANGDLFRESILAGLVELGDDSFQASLNDCTFAFPAACWENARMAGLSFREVLLAVHANVFAVLADLTRSVALSAIMFSSLYRETGGGPHTDGRGIDIKGLAQIELDWILIERPSQETPPEPDLVREVRRWLWNDNRVSQVLGPWFMCSAGRGCHPNRAQTELEQIHLTHLHFTAKP